MYRPIGSKGLSVCQWPGRPVFNPRTSHTKDPKTVLDTSLLNTQNYNVCSNVKWSNPGNGVALPQHLCVVRLLVPLHFGRQLYLYIYMYILTNQKHVGGE